MFKSALLPIKLIFYLSLCMPLGLGNYLKHIYLSLCWLFIYSICFKKSSQRNPYIYIYIYIYIYLSLSLSLNFTFFFLLSKPAQLYVRLSIIPLSQQVNHISSGIIRHHVVTFVCLHFCLTIYQSAQFIWRTLHYASGSHKFLCQSAQSPWRSIYIYIFMYIYIYIYVYIYTSYININIIYFIYVCKLILIYIFSFNINISYQ